MALLSPGFDFGGALIALSRVRALAADNRAAADTPAIAMRAGRIAPSVLWWGTASEAPALAQRRLLYMVAFHRAVIPPWWCPTADAKR